MGCPVILSRFDEDLKEFIKGAFFDSKFTHKKCVKPPLYAY